MNTRGFIHVKKSLSVYHVDHITMNHLDLNVDGTDNSSIKNTISTILFEPEQYDNYRSGTRLSTATGSSRQERQRPRCGRWYTTTARRLHCHLKKEKEARQAERAGASMSMTRTCTQSSWVCYSSLSISLVKTNIFAGLWLVRKMILKIKK